MLESGKVLSSALADFTIDCLNREWPLPEVSEIIMDSFTDVSIEQAADKMSLLVKKAKDIRTLKELSQLIEQLNQVGWKQ